MLLTLSDTGVDKEDIVPIMISIVYDSKALVQKLTSNIELTRSHIVPIMISIVYDSKALVQKLTSNIELTRSHNVKNLSQHTALNINLRQSRLLLAISRSILLRKTAIPPVAMPQRKTVIPPIVMPHRKTVIPSVAMLHRKTVIPSVAMSHRKTVVPSVAMLHRKTIIPSVAMPHRKTVVSSKANTLFASANPDLARIRRKIIQKGESELRYSPFTRE